MMRATSCATTTTMTLDMVLEVVLAFARNYSHPVPHTRYTPDASHAHADTPSPPCNKCPQALLPWKSLPMANVTAHPGGSLKPPA